MECKNLKESFPLVIHATQRERRDSFHNILCKRPPYFSKIVRGENANVDFSQRTSNIKIIGAKTPYLPGQWVGKGMDQIGLSNDTPPKFVTSDRETYEKMNQSVNSAMEMITLVEDHSELYYRFIAVLPILVVPNNTLWQINYKIGGQVDGTPNKVNHVQYYLNQEFTITEYKTRNYVVPEKRNYTFTHLDIVTLDAIPTLLESYFNNDDNEPHFFGVNQPDLKDYAEENWSVL